jgi:hypothetical protein
MIVPRGELPTKVASLLDKLMHSWRADNAESASDADDKSDEAFPKENPLDAAN